MNRKIAHIRKKNYLCRTKTLNPNIKMADIYTEPTVIVCGGDFPTHPIPTRLMQEAQQLVCCDGAAYDVLRHGLKPWRIVGDCDSILAPQNDDETKMLEENRHLIVRYPGQDDNDLTKTVRYCLEQGFSELAIVGATGRREDHTLANISLLAEYQRMGADVRIYTNHGIFMACHDRAVLDVEIPEGFVAVSDTIATRQKSTQISVFNLTAHGLHATGLRYPLYDFTQWWQGTLNEATASPVIIEGKGDFIVFVCYPTPS